jgi:hypothetical protein
MAAAIALDIVRKTGGNDRGCRNIVVVLQGTGKFGDTRRASISAADAEDSGVTIFLDFSPEFGFIGEHAGFLIA